MNQTRVFLLFAWLMVAVLLWMEWGKERAAPPVATPAAAAATGAVPAPTAVGAVPAAPAAGAKASVGPAAGVPAEVRVVTDVLDIAMTGGELRRADLLKVPDVGDAKGAVRLLDTDPQRLFVAQSGWTSAGNKHPTHEAGFVPASAGPFVLAAGAGRLDVPFVWTGPDGVTIRRTYTFLRGQYTVTVRDEVVNAGAAPWQGFVYRQLSRVPRQLARSGPTSAEQYSFQGAAWFSPQDKYEKRDYEDLVDEAALTKQVKGGWIAMLQHHLFAAWIPERGDATTFQTATFSNGGATQYVIREVGPQVAVGPGQRAVTQARLWVGPKLVGQIEAQGVPGLERAVDFSSYSLFATLAGWLYAVLAFLHGGFRDWMGLSWGGLQNWGWSIVGLVFLIKLVLLPLSNAQYKSTAKTRRLQPKLQQLKERYGEDRQQFQMAMLELYRKEKVNPAGGCLPILVQMPIFLALYWMLSESVELRHAPWMLWIQDLTARDPYFVLPAINMIVMYVTQRLTPMVGMDPMQQKMMQFMPLVFGVMFALFPSGLVLYWVTNGLLSLAQQWWFLRLYGDKAPAKTAAKA
ncbi:membrane protein insertase YidC [Lysobacter humi (ex Lee et al. 2017)]